MKQLLIYLPVIHAGYEALLDRHPDATEVLVIGGSFADEFPVMRKEIRALTPESAAGYLRSRGAALGAAVGAAVTVVERDDLAATVVAEVLVVPDETMMRTLVSAYHLDDGREVRYERTFLRWDRSWALPERPAGYDGTIAADDLSLELMRRAAAAAADSPDWWRQVGAVAVRDGEVLGVEHNQHRPTEYTAYLDGDPRNEFSRGVHIDLSVAVHAEAVLIARAARTGIALAKADIYVTTFPCPPCARLIAEAGFARCFFAGPYAVLDGDAVMRAAGVELIWVDTTN